ncbi:MinD/ParA family protein [Microbacterium sp. NPDC057659]|uniref:nucleotide-binding protein n=1 Tax=Microbacterium sp. NPDC057659 TaxID=3346198 RepID=UPI003672CA95
MPQKKNDDQDGDDTLGVLDDSASLDDAGIGFLGATAQVSVVMPTGGDDEDLDADDDVLGDEISTTELVSDLVIDRSGVADEETLERLDRDTTEIIIELPAEIEEPVVVDEPDVVTAEVVLDEDDAEDDVDAVDRGLAEDNVREDEELEDEELEDEELVDESADAGSAELESAAVETPEAGIDEDATVEVEPSEVEADEDEVAEDEVAEVEPAEVESDEDGTAEVEADDVATAEVEADEHATDEDERDGDVEDGADEESDAPDAGSDDEADDLDEPDEDDEFDDEELEDEDLPADDEDDDDLDEEEEAEDDVDDLEDEAAEELAPVAEPEQVDEVVSDELPAEEHPEEELAAAEADQGEDLDAEAADEQDRKDEVTAEASVAAAVAGTLTAPEEETTVDTDDKRDLAPRTAAGAPRTRAEAHRTAEIALASKRLGDASRDSSRESADLLTAERLLDPSRMVKPEPEGTWSHLVYTVSGRRINLGDSKKARARKELSGRIAGTLQGNARFVPVLSRKGGVGKTTVTALLGMALADARDDRVIAVDANPDRGTLADRIVGDTSHSVRDLVRAKDEVQGFHDVSALVARDHTRLDVLASDSDPRVAEAFSDADYRDVAGVAAHYYSLVLTDTGTGIVHDVMGATLDLADQIVIVSGLSVDEARLASETLTWLETNGYGDKARDAVVVLNQSTPGTPLVRLNELQAHFSTRVGHVVRIPYDPQIAGGGAIVWSSLAPETRLAARELAAELVEGLRSRVPVR